MTRQVAREYYRTILARDAQKGMGTQQGARVFNFKNTLYETHKSKNYYLTSLNILRSIIKQKSQQV